MAPQVVELLRIELEHEVFRKPVRVALDGPDESFGLDTVERREVGIEHHPVPAKLKYRLFDAPHRNRESGQLVGWLRHAHEDREVRLKSSAGESGNCNRIGRGEEASLTQ